MKKFGMFMLFCVLCLGAFAEVQESDLYYVNVKVLRAFTHRKGYYIIYRTSKMELAEAFIPYSWFKPADKRAKLDDTMGDIDPYLSLYTKDGKFDHVKVVLPLENPKDLTWGTLRYPYKYDESFNNETLELKF